MKQNRLKQFIILSVLIASIFSYIDLHQTKAKQTEFANNTSGLEISEESFLAGEWSATFRVNNMQCQWDAVFHPNGSYAATTQCYNTPYSVYYSGSWYMLQRNAVRLEYSQCAPRDCPVSGETLRFQIINQNTIRFSDRVAYRVG